MCLAPILVSPRAIAMAAAKRSRWHALCRHRQLMLREKNTSHQNLCAEGASAPTKTSRAGSMKTNWPHRERCLRSESDSQGRLKQLSPDWRWRVPQASGFNCLQNWTINRYRFCTMIILRWFWSKNTIKSKTQRWTNSLFTSLAVKLYLSPRYVPIVKGCLFRCTGKHVFQYFLSTRSTRYMYCSG